MKTISFNHLNLTIGQSEKAEWEHYVHLTSKLIKRPYIATHKLVEQWSLEKLIRHYELCTKHQGDMPCDVKWWWLRKKD